MQLGAYFRDAVKRTHMERRVLFALMRLSPDARLHGRTVLKHEGQHLAAEGLQRPRLQVPRQDRPWRAHARGRCREESHRCDR
jgi:hypothetical protein